MKPVRGSGEPRLPFWRRHAGLGAFLAAFFVCAALFGGIAYAIMRPILAGSGAAGGGAAAANGGEPAASAAAPAAAPAGGFTMLVSVYSNKDLSAVQLLLYRLDAAKKRTVLLPVPLELGVTRQGKTSSLADIYLHGGNSDARAALSSLLSVKIGYGCDINSKNFVGVFGSLGGLYLPVPRNISCVLPDSSTVVSLKASSRQYLSGQKLYALLAGAGYGSQAERYGEQAAVMKEFLAEKTTGVYMQSPGQYYGPLFNLVSTGYSMTDLLRDAAALQAYSGAASVMVARPAYRASAADPKLLSFASAAQVSGLFS